MKHFREHYGNKKITKWDIFYYVYGVLHHPGLPRAVRREPQAGAAPHPPGPGLPRPLPRRARNWPGSTSIMRNWSRGRSSGSNRPTCRSRTASTTRCGSARTRPSLKVNDSLTLAGIPPEVFEYRLGNRSALEWVIDQYQVSEDKRSGIRSDPNRPDDPEYIVRLVGQVVRVSIETVKIVDGLPADFGGGGRPGSQTWSQSVLMSQNRRLTERKVLSGNHVARS